MVEKQFTPDEISLELANLSSITKRDLVEKLTETPFMNATLDVLCGRNLRNFTESLTRRRLWKAYLEAFENYISIRKDYPSSEEIINKALLSQKSNNPKKYSKGHKNVLNWFLGITGKSTQNVLRDDKGSELDDHAQNLIHDIKKNSEGIDHKLTVLSKNQNSLELDIDDLLYFLNIIGSLTLTIRGSEKSLHGKTFEMLILGTIFQILGFKLIKKNDVSHDEYCFWLSSKKGGRESDATLIYKARGVRIDIGFIGRGNTEITLDKVSRYTRKLEIGGNKFEMDTIILVDSIGDRSNVDELAKKIKGKILRMSDSRWVLSMSDELKKVFESDEIGLPNNLRETREVHKYLKANINEIDFNSLLNS